MVAIHQVLHDIGVQSERHRALDTRSGGPQRGRAGRTSQLREAVRRSRRRYPSPCRLLRRPGLARPVLQGRSSQRSRYVVAFIPPSWAGGARRPRSVPMRLCCLLAADIQSALRRSETARLLNGSVQLRWTGHLTLSRCLECRIESNRTCDPGLLEVCGHRTGRSPMTPRPFECIHWILRSRSYVRIGNSPTPCRPCPFSELLIVEPTTTGARSIGPKVTSAS